MDFAILLDVICLVMASVHMVQASFFSYGQLDKIEHLGWAILLILGAHI